jgi:hypothetical protein
MSKAWLCIFGHLTKFQLGEVSRTLHCCWIDNESVINMLLEFVGTAPILLTID